VDYDTGLFDLEFDASPYGGVVLGNIFTHLETGAMFRIGQDLAKDRGGPPRIRPSLPGSDYYAVSDGYSWYLFAGMNGRAVARNIFLDGNSFADGYSTHKKPFVGDFQVGFGVTVQNARLAYTQIFRTKEFKNQAQQDQFGAITLSYQF
jgi:lipid A 3-O-deacylase